MIGWPVALSPFLMCSAATPVWRVASAKIGRQSPASEATPLGYVVELMGVGGDSEKAIRLLITPNGAVL